MGTWDLLPADSECWHGEHTSRYFKQVFGIPKGILTIMTLENGLGHVYVPVSYRKLLYQTIKRINMLNYKNLERKLLKFYKFKLEAKKNIPKINKGNLRKITNQTLIYKYIANRDWCHQATVFDQFGWIGEDYWLPLMEDILVRKLGLKKNSLKYQKVLFALTKPAEISTTLTEKKEILRQVIKIKTKKTTLLKASKKMAREFGFMPVFTYGTPWDDEYYKEELKGLLKNNLTVLENEYSKLVKYKMLRNKSINEIVKKYKLTKRDLQVFTDFGLTLDTRNEAEYLVSYSGYYLLPLYREIARRLALSVKQIRTLYEAEIVAALKGKIDAGKILQTKKKIVAYGFDQQMKKRINFSSAESQKMFDYIESYVKLVQGSISGRGLCANTGIVVGKAKILNSIKEISKVKSGDILITETTSVDSLPAMKRAAAFVTEVGGLTCHAAVVAREFGVPCIVSYKNVTKKFKDGELVEVDANAGVVRKMK